MSLAAPPFSVSLSAPPASASSPLVPVSVVLALKVSDIPCVALESPSASTPWTATLVTWLRNSLLPTMESSWNL